METCQKCYQPIHPDQNSRYYTVEHPSGRHTVVYEHVTCSTAPDLATKVTKRELFAAMLMAGINANSELDMMNDEAARTAVEQADALIEALNEDKQ